MKKSTKILRYLGVLISALLSLAAKCSAEDGAKDLFYRQQSMSTNPARSLEMLNTGIQYWIELKRAGKTLNVSNKFSFKSGDKIRIHLKSNVDAYAYVILQEGSSGEQSVLFPDSRFHDKNKLNASVDYSIPQEGDMAFDQNPGTERLLLLLSRTPLDPTKYLANKTNKPVVIAAAPSGAKDLIPGSVVLAYSKQDALQFGAPSQSKSQHQLADASPGLNPRCQEAQFASSSEDATTTLVQKDPALVLSVDLALMHNP